MQNQKKQQAIASQTSQENKISDLFWACEKGDIESVRLIVSNTEYGNLNKLEPHGSTALHAASSSGHVEVVRFLLHECEVMRHQLNRYGQTAYEDAATDEIRQLFHRPPNSGRFCDSTRIDDMHCPIGVIGYDKEEDTNENNGKSRRWIGKAEGKGDIDQIRTGICLMHYATSSKLLRRIVLEIGRQLDVEKHYHDEQMAVDIMQQILDEKVTTSSRHFRQANALLAEYAQTSNLESVYRLYTLDTPFYSTINENTSGLFGLYFGLNKLKPRAFQGLSYRGLSMTYESLCEYQWAQRCSNKRIVYTRSFCSTSIYRYVTEAFRGVEPSSDKISTLMVFDFSEPCDTAIILFRTQNRLPCISDFEEEREVLILPGTIFQVSKIDMDEISRKCTIYLRNVTGKWKLVPLIKCFWNAKKMLRKIGS